MNAILASILATTVSSLLTPVKVAANNIKADPTTTNAAAQVQGLAAGAALSVPTLEQTGIHETATIILDLIAKLEADIAKIGQPAAAASSAGASTASGSAA